MNSLAPLPVVVGLLTAAFLAGAGRLLPRLLIDALSLVCALAMAALCALLLAHASHSAIVYWFGGFHPVHGVALGISFAIDPLGAGMATLAAVMVSAALLYSVRYFDEVGPLFSVLMLVFGAAMVGFCLTGDLFDFFVFFELMSVAAYALTAYKIEEAGPLQGAINFAITNSVGSFMMLTGIALLYGRTGALNMAQIGRSLAEHPADGLVTIALLLIMGGLLVKAAIVPFHFWLADAHAVAPVPVCVLFSGVMVELALYGFARVYWTTLASPLTPHAPGLRATLIGLGTLSALVGAVMCLAQRHLKRLLAFSTISHSGLFLIGVGLLTPAGLAASGGYVIEHAFLKGALFMAAGILLHRFGSVDEHELRGRGRERDPGLRAAGIVFTAGGLLLAALPPLGTFTGKAALETSLSEGPGYAWAIAVVVGASALTGGAILRAAGRVFAGWGPRVHPHHELLLETSERPETLQPHDHTPPVMIVPAVLLLAIGGAIGLVPGLSKSLAAAASRAVDGSAYATAVLGHAIGHRGAVPAPRLPLETLDFVLAALSVLGAVGVASVALAKRPYLRTSPLLTHAATSSLILLRRAQSGCVNDYIAWLVAGLAAIGTVLALT